MKITFDQSDKAQAFVTSVALSTCRNLLLTEINCLANKRSGCSAVRALHISSLREKLREVQTLQEQIDLARRLAGFL